MSVYAAMWSLGLLADFLTKNGFAVLRYDDRGYGDSEGDFNSATSLDFAKDAKAAVTFLKSKSIIDSKKIGLIGHSEGGLIAPIIEVTSKDELSFLVLLAAPGINGYEITQQQLKDILEFRGVDQSLIPHALKLNEVILNYVINTPSEKINSQDLQAVFSKKWDGWPDELKDKMREKALPVINEQGIRHLNSPWHKYFLTHDPQKWLSKVKAPTLALAGSKDVQLHSNQNLPAIRNALELSGNKQVNIIELEGLNHLFQQAETGLINEYASIEETFAPEALEVIAKWIQGVTNQNN